MTKEEIFEGLKEVFATVKPKLDQSKIGMDSSLVLDLGIDSLSMLLMSLAVEQKFGFQFKSDTAPFKTVADVVEYVSAAIR